ncbi:replication initiator [Streptomyces sp. NPDC058371]|uniref:replication initiator n=1 Tax=Streptomyces sp. NPDC058371 TaxID=3346463 RepID=UPI00365D86BF
MASARDSDRWYGQICRTGGCADPIYLTGRTLANGKVTGEIPHHYSAESELCGRLRVACGNSRASRCASSRRLATSGIGQLQTARLAERPSARLLPLRERGRRWHALGHLLAFRWKIVGLGTS